MRRATASTQDASSGSSSVGWPVALARSQPWVSGGGTGWSSRTLLSFGRNVEVVSPPEVRADLAAVAADVVAQYSNSRLGLSGRMFE
jgi:hypothetical protein